MLTNVKDNKAFTFTWKRLGDYFERQDISFDTDIHLTFVCGATDRCEGEQPTMRQKFVAWATENEQSLVCVIAERAISDLLRRPEERKSKSNLSTLEGLIAKTVHSIVLFPESSGSFAELGLFSANKEIAKKMLVAIDAKHQNGSFITLGPLKHTSLLSQFTPFPVTTSSDLEISFKQISSRLLRDASSKRPYKTKFHKKDWKSYSHIEQFSLLDHLVEMTGAWTEDDLFDFISKFFGKYDASLVRLLICLLSATGRITITETGDLIRRGNRKARFISGNEEQELEIKSKWTEAFRAYSPETLSLLERAGT